MFSVYLSELHSYSPCTDMLGGLFEHVPETISFSDGGFFLVKSKTFDLQTENSDYCSEVLDC